VRQLGFLRPRGEDEDADDDMAAVVKMWRDEHPNRTSDSASSSRPQRQQDKGDRGGVSRQAMERDDVPGERGVGGGAVRDESYRRIWI
jgi:hypothetical protein